MRFSCNWGRGKATRLLIGASTALALLSLGAPSAKATSTETSSVTSSAGHWVVETKKGRRPASQRYFIEFRGRAAASYGHMYVLYGKVNDRDEIISSRIAGLHPAGDAADCFNCSVFNWTIGHLIFVPSETGASDGDLEEKYVTARYRVWMDYAHFKELDAYIRKLQKDNPLWNALWNNCVEFGRSIARHMKLRMPLIAWQEPKDFVTALREMNGMKKEQLPLKDAATTDAAPRWSHTASRTPPLPPHRPKLEPVSASRVPLSEAAPVAPKKKPAASEDAKPVAPEAKPKQKKVENKPAGNTAVASTGSAH